MTALLEEKTQSGAKLHPMRLTGEMFDRMLEAGVLNDDVRVELLDGQLFEKEDMKPPHIRRVQRLAERLTLQFHGRVLVFNQSAIDLPQDGRPLPDLSLVNPKLPEDAFATPTDIYLVLEVSDSSLDKDRDLKLKLYARDGIREYWIVNLSADQLEVYRDPDGERYATSFTLKAGQIATCLEFPDDGIDWS